LSGLTCAHSPSGRAYIVENEMVFTLESELVWGLLGKHTIFAEFLIATAIVIFVWIKNSRHKE